MLLLRDITSSPHSIWFCAISSPGAVVHHGRAQTSRPHLISSHLMSFTRRWMLRTPACSILLQTRPLPGACPIPISPPFSLCPSSHLPFLVCHAFHPRPCFLGQQQPAAAAAAAPGGRQQCPARRGRRQEQGAAAGDPRRRPSPPRRRTRGANEADKKGTASSWGSVGDTPVGFVSVARLAVPLLHTRRAFPACR